MDLLTNEKGELVTRDTDLTLPSFLQGCQPGWAIEGFHLKEAQRLSQCRNWVIEEFHWGIKTQIQCVTLRLTISNISYMLKSSPATYDAANHNYILQSLRGCQPTDLQVWGEGCLFLVRQRQKSNLDGNVERKVILYANFQQQKSGTAKLQTKFAKNTLEGQSRTMEQNCNTLSKNSTRSSVLFIWSISKN